MTATNRTRMEDMERTAAEADLYGVQFSRVRRLKYAASLYGKTQWIDVDAGNSRCLF